MMKKRGQVFILAALILSFIIFSLVVKVNIAERNILEGDFEDLSRNYDIESAKFINLLTEMQFRNANLRIEDVSVLFLNFTQDFTKYSKTQKPGFGVVYFFDFEAEDRGGQRVGKLFVGNYLDQDIVVWTQRSREELINGCRESVNAGASFGIFRFNTGVQTFNFNCTGVLSRTNNNNYEFKFIIGDIEYNSSISVGEAKIGIVAQEFRDNERRVYINKFIKGEVVDVEDRCREISENYRFRNSFVCDCNRRDEESCEDLHERCFYCENRRQCMRRGATC